MLHEPPVFFSFMSFSLFLCLGDMNIDDSQHAVLIPVVSLSITINALSPILIPDSHIHIPNFKYIYIYMFTVERYKTNIVKYCQICADRNICAHRYDKLDLKIILIRNLLLLCLTKGTSKRTSTVTSKGTSKGLFISCFFDHHISSTVVHNFRPTKKPIRFDVY